MKNELDRLIVDYEGYIYGIVNKCFPYYKYKEDLFQVGSVGLINAYQRYDDSKGSKLTTYAYPYILGEMRKLVREDRGIKVSREITKLNLKIEKVYTYLAQKKMGEPTIEEISEFLDIPEFYIAEALKSNNPLQSIDEPISGDGKVITLHEVVRDPNEMDLNSLIALKQELSTLTPFEKSIIETRYMKDLTQSQAAKQLGISQVQVSRNEQKVLSKLKMNLVA